MAWKSVLIKFNGVGFPDRAVKSKDERATSHVKKFKVHHMANVREGSGQCDRNPPAQNVQYRRLTPTQFSTSSALAQSQL